MRSNGAKKWLLALLAAILMALGSWSGATTISNSERIAGVESTHVEFRGWLERVDRKLDQLLERR